MSPLMLFMSSSLNVELVYTILYGIGKFTLLNFMRNEFTKEQMEQFKAMEYRVDRYGDTTITIREIVINNINQWNNVNYDDIVNDDKVDTTLGLSNSTQDNKQAIKRLTTFVGTSIDSEG